jgi:hypothetical protein
MGRPFLLVLLGVGTLAGFAAGFRSVRHGALSWDHHWSSPHSMAAWADACLSAAERRQPPGAAPSAAP